MSTLSRRLDQLEKRLHDLRPPIRVFWTPGADCPRIVHRFQCAGGLLAVEPQNAGRDGPFDLSGITDDQLRVIVESGLETGAIVRTACMALLAAIDLFLKDVGYDPEAQT